MTIFKQPTAAAPRPVPPQLLVNVLACMLREGGKDITELQTAFSSLVAERHRHFHVSAARPELDWLKCTNPVCCQMARLLEKSRQARSEIRLTPMSITAASGLRVMFEAHPNYLRVFAEEKSIIEKPRIIIP